MSAESKAENVEPGSAEDLWARLDGGDPAAIVAFFKGMPEKGRRSHAKTVKAHLAATRWQSFHDESTHAIDWVAFHARSRAGARTQVPAAVATISGAGAVATYLGRVYSRVDVDASCLTAVREALTDREPSWLADLADAVATTLGPVTSRCPGVYALVTALAESAGVVPEASAGFVRFWAESYRDDIYMPEVHAAFFQDPRLAELLPLTFDDDLNDALYSDRTHFPDVVLKAVEQGVAPRADMLDGSLRRLLRGGRGGAMQAHLKFWTALQPTDAEIVERLSSCISLLSAENGTVARTFLASIRRVADAGLIDVELALEAASIAVTRSEKGMVKSALGWLDALADAHPERAGEIVGHLAAAFGAQAAELQERAVKLIGKRAKALSEADRQRSVAEAEVYLAPDLAARLAGLLGVEQDSVIDDTGAGYPELPPYTPRPLLPAIESPAELAEVVAAVLVKGPAEAMVLERVLEGIVRFRRTDAAGLAAALAPVTKGRQGALHQLVEAAAGLGETAREMPQRFTVAQLWSWMPKSRHGAGGVPSPTPEDVLTLRISEIWAHLGAADLPPLVSVPTAATGSLDPAELAARLRTAESEGWVPLTVDFEQALLRLPRDCGDVDTSGFTSEAGRRFAAWVAGERLEVDPAKEWLTQAPTSLFDLVPEAWDHPRNRWHETAWDVCWPAILPTHPDLTALALNGGKNLWYEDRGSPEAVPAVAEQDDPHHVGTHRLIGTGLVGPDARHRAAAVDAALILTARGALDPAELAFSLTRILRTDGTLRHLTPCLRDLAEAGAAPQAWAVIAALLPGILPPAFPRSQAGTADLLGLAAELADGLSVRTPIAEVSATAAKKASSAVANAARRLDGVLRGE